jgi:hypothetical protein
MFSCGARGTLDHVISSCHVALTQGRYTWRHDQVLREVADTLERERKSRNKPANPKAGLIMFVKEGQINPAPSTRLEDGM